MPQSFPKKEKNKAQWHFDNQRGRQEYDLNDEDIHTDVLGSYTGTPYDGVSPVQDADDL